jgi:hypothetical protein
MHFYAIRNRNTISGDHKWWSGKNWSPNPKLYSKKQHLGSAISHHGWGHIDQIEVVIFSTQEHPNALPVSFWKDKTYREKWLKEEGLQ